MEKETLEEVAEVFWLNDDSMTDNDRISYVNGFLACAKWQQEQYSTEEKHIGHTINEFDKTYIEGFNNGAKWQQERSYRPFESIANWISHS